MGVKIDGICFNFLGSLDKMLSQEEKLFLADFVCKRKQNPYKHSEFNFYVKMIISSSLCYYTRKDNYFLFQNTIEERCGISFYRNVDNLFHIYDEVNSVRTIIAFQGTTTFSQWIRNIGLMFLKLFWHFDLKKICKEIINVLKERPEREYYLVGHSAGGYIAQFIAMKFCLSGLSINSPALYFLGFLPIVNITHQIDGYADRGYNTRYQYFYNHTVEGDMVFEKFGRNFYYYGEIVNHEGKSNRLRELHGINPFIEMIVKDIIKEEKNVEKNTEMIEEWEYFARSYENHLYIQNTINKTNPSFLIMFSSIFLSK